MAPKMRIEGAEREHELEVSEKAARVTEAPATNEAAAESPAAKKQAAAHTNSKPSKKKPAVHIDKAEENAAQADETSASEASKQRTSASASAGTTSAPSSRNPVAWVSRVVPGHEHAVLGGVAGLLIALLIFIVGFWKTIFVTLLVCVGIAFGQYLDGDPKIINLLRRFLAGGTGDE